MKVKSLIQNGYQLVPVEVEVTLISGLPQIKIMGLPDTAIKESQLRIKSALKQCEFSLPKAEQVLVNLKPSYTKKTSHGLDLAIAIAYLLKTEQIPEESARLYSNAYIYGELGLEGEVLAPEDVIDFFPKRSETFQLVTGPIHQAFEFPYYCLNSLKDIAMPSFIESVQSTLKPERPEPKSWLFDEDEVDLLALVASGRHSILLAGPAGSGKTTFGEALHQVLPDPTQESLYELKRTGRWFQENRNWYPYVHPHHSIPTISMLGGGVPLKPGEITRAHLGVLHLDEFLEFKSEVREALRLPLEGEKIKIARKGRAVSFPAKSWIVGSTNLCPCGDQAPDAVVNCKRTLGYCQSYQARLTGPLSDRFAILKFTSNKKQGGEFELSEVIKKVRIATKFRREVRGQVMSNADLDPLKIKQQIEPNFQVLVEDHFGSMRRHKAWLQVARTLADMRESELIGVEDLRRAKQHTLDSFYKLKRMN